MLLAASPTAVPDRFMSSLARGLSGGGAAAPSAQPATQHSTHAQLGQGAEPVRGAPAAGEPAQRPQQQSAVDADGRSLESTPQQAQGPDMYMRHAELSAADAQEPLLAPNEERFCMYPIRCVTIVCSLWSAVCQLWCSAKGLHFKNAILPPDLSGHALAGVRMFHSITMEFVPLSAN